MMEAEKSEFDLELFQTIEGDYILPSTPDWINSQAVAYWESLNDRKKQQLLSVSSFDLRCFASDFLKHPSVRTLLQDAVVYFDLHRTWEVYICPKPSCLRWFREGESLILHLKNEHLSKMNQISVWPLQQRNLAEEKWCADAVDNMVWKPVDVEAAVDMLSRVCLHHDNVSVADVCAGRDSLCSLQWPLSKDTVKGELLAELRELFEYLKPRDASFSLLSNGLMRTVAALASKNILVQLSPRENVHILGVVLRNSPISFRFLDENSLSVFVQLVRKIEQYFRTTMKSPPKESNLNKGDMNWEKCEILDAVSYDCDNLTFILDYSKTRYICSGDVGGIPSWLSSAPCQPIIDKMPVEVSELYHRVERTSNCFIDGLHVFNRKLQDQKVSTQLEPYYLELVQSWCELLCLEPLVRRLCHLDFRMYILPLLRSFFRMSLYIRLKDSQQETHPIEVDSNIDYNDIDSEFDGDDYDYEAISGSDGEREFEIEPEDSNNKQIEEGQPKNSHHELHKGEPDTVLDDTKQRTSDSHKPPTLDFID